MVHDTIHVKLYKTFLKGIPNLKKDLDICLARG